MITSTNLFTTLGASAPMTVSPATRQADDFLALLQAELGKSGGSDLGAPDSTPVKPTAYGAPTPMGSYIKPMYLGVPIDLEPPDDEASKPGPDGVPTDVNGKPTVLGAPIATEPPIAEVPKGAPTEVDGPAVVAEEAADIDLGAPTDEILKA
jgi:hypothetical protein